MRFSEIYIYIDGADLHEIAESLLARLDDWQQRESSNAIVVNDQYPRTPDLEPEDLPDWNLGLNLDLRLVTREELERTIEFLIRLAEAFQRDFVIGCHDSTTGMSEDMTFFGFESRSRSAKKIVREVLGNDA